MGIYSGQKCINTARKKDMEASSQPARFMQPPAQARNPLPQPKPLNQVGSVPLPAQGWLPRPKPAIQPTTSLPRLRQETRCFNCGRIGHLRAECKLPNRATEVKDIETNETGDLGAYESVIYGEESDNSDPGKGEA